MSDTGTAFLHDYSTVQYFTDTYFYIVNVFSD